MIEELKAETRLFKLIDLKTAFIIMGFILLGVVMKENVYSKLQVPFIIFNGIIGLTFCIPSPFNRDKRMWQSLIIYLLSLNPSKPVYHAVEHEEVEENKIKAMQLMYTKAEGEE